MFNILSYFEISLESEIIIWSLLDVLVNVFDSSIFRFKSNLQQVWQMNMPSETLSLATKNFLKSVISSLVCLEAFTVHLYLAAYIVLLYPVTCADRSGMALPWLLVAAVRRLLVTLLTLATGLVACLLLPPRHAHPACSLFVLKYVARLAAAVYMWYLVYIFYCRLKGQIVFLARAAEGDGFERAVRRRRAKSLYSEELVRSAIFSKLDELPSVVVSQPDPLQSKSQELIATSSTSLVSPARDNLDAWLAGDLRLRRDSDRVNDQIAAMALRVAAFLTCSRRCLGQPSNSDHVMAHVMKLPRPSALSPHSDTPLNLPHFYRASNVPKIKKDIIPKSVFSYLENYPLIFMKQPENTLNSKQLSDVRSLMEQQPLFPQQVSDSNEVFAQKSNSESVNSISCSDSTSVGLGPSLTDESGTVVKTYRDVLDDI